MLRTLFFIVKLAVVVLVAVWLANRPGDVVLQWFGYRIETSVGILLLVALLIGVVIALLYRWWGLLRSAPRKIGKVHQESRARRGYKALTQGMVAVAAGDAEEAQRWARKADGLLDQPPLTMLLSAQAAQLDGDDKAAKRYFEAMLERDETRFLGLRGLLMQALRDKDDTAALNYARQAYALRPKTPWVLDMLFDLSERNGDLIAAEQALREATRLKQLPPADSSRKRALLLVEQAQAAAGNGDRDAALRLAKQAHKLSADLVPATLLQAELMIDAGRGRDAARLLEKAWPAKPHPDLAAAYRRARSQAGERDSIEMLKAVERLVAAVPSHTESRLALAEAALDAKLWGEARRYLADAAGTDGVLPSERICRLMAGLEEAEHGDGARARDWWLKAAEAQPDPAWVCSACGAVAERWTARCGACNAFDTLDWTTPPRVAGPLVTLEEEPVAPALPKVVEETPGKTAEAVPAPPQ